jgi:L-rhamnose isomerase/sugar isomerase
VLVEAFESDLRPLLGRLREELGVAADPVEAFRAGGYAEKLANERGTASVESAYEQL